jgi:hypothetical protein
MTDHSSRPTLLSAWRSSLADPRFRWELAVTLATLVAVLTLLASFLKDVERRPGVVLPDPVLALFAPLDLTWLTFALIYIGLVVAILVLSRHPSALLIAVQSYAMMVLLRIAAMYLVPLESPPTMIALVDPTVETFGTGTTLTKDLFFSGHTSTLFLLFLTVPGRLWKAIFLSCALAVGIAVLVQHVHYTIDVFAAPFFAFGAFSLVKRLRAVLLTPPSEALRQ